LRILVTGAAGFVGSSFCNHLESQGLEYTGLDNLQFGYKDNLVNKDRLVVKRINQIDKLFIDQFDVLVHLATANIIYAQDHMVETFASNALDTIKLFEMFRGKIIYTSTTSVYGQAGSFPTKENAPVKVSNAYDQSKYIAELYLKTKRLHTILRLSNVYGPNQRPDHPYSGVIGKFIGQARKKEPLLVYGDGMSTRDYTYIDDVIDALCKAIERPSINDVVNISTGKDTSTLMVAYAIADLMGITFDGKHIRFVDNRSIDNIEKRCLCNEKAYKLLGWSPHVSLKEGLINVIDSLK